jgi:hypothetical protein
MENQIQTTQSSMVTNEQVTEEIVISIKPESEKFYSRFQPYEEITKEEFDKRRYPWCQ